MHWKFWQRQSKDEIRDREIAAASFPPQKFVGAEPEGIGWLPLAGSAREILGLQQLIGNQAVVRLLAPEKPRGFSQGRKN